VAGPWILVVSLAVNKALPLAGSQLVIQLTIQEIIGLLLGIK